MATRFLESDQEVSNIINPDGVSHSGGILIVFFGTMVGDEKWQIEQAEVDANPRQWSAVHSTDFSNATHAPGTPNQNATIDRWMGVRDANRVFEVPIADGFVYRARLVWKSGTATIASSGGNANTSVTACWAEAKTKLWL